MESTRKRLELTQFLVELFEKTPHEVISKIVYLIQGKLRPDFEGIELGVAEKLAIRAISKSSGIAIKKIEEEYTKGGDLGHAAAIILEQKTQTTFLMENITVERVYDTLFKIAKLEGARSQDMKIKYISSLLNDANPLEASFILKVLLGTLRLGIAENTVMDALAIAYSGNKENRKLLQNAYNVSSDLGKVAETISIEGIEGIKKFKIQLFNPIRPMLADRVKSEQEAIEKMGRKICSIEFKLRWWTCTNSFRRMRKVDLIFKKVRKHFKGIIQILLKIFLKSLNVQNAILEAEAVAINEDTGDFLPFQELMHRRRKYNDG